MQIGKLIKRLLVDLWLVIVKLLSRAIEEFLPFAYFYYVSHQWMKKIYQSSMEDIDFYSRLSDEKLEKRLGDEHERAQKIDDKTSKFTLGLSISLTIISASASSIVKVLPSSALNNYIVLLFGISSLYMLSGGLLALGALKTLPKFGYGTNFEYNKSSVTLVTSLIGQEKINIIRHFRNELSFMSLRNGFLLIFMALFLCVIVLSNDIKADSTENKIYDNCRSLTYKI